VSHCSVDGVPFGCRVRHIHEFLGEPDKARTNYTGELEMLYGTSIYRCFADRFVECTVPDAGRFQVNGVAILSIFEWLAVQPHCIDRARFRISADAGIAYDYRDPANGSLTLFEKGRWDGLLAIT